MNGGVLKRIFGYIKKYPLSITIVILLSVASVLLSLYIPVLIGRAIDLAAGANDVDIAGIAKILLTIAAIAAITGVITWITNLLNNKTAFNISRDLRASAMHKVQRLPLSYIDAHAHGDIVSRIITDSEQFSDGILLAFTQLFTGCVTIIGTICYMLGIDILISLVVILITPLSLFIAKFITKKTFSYFRTQSETRAEQTSFIEETVSAQKVVKAYSHEKENTEKFDEINHRLKICNINAVFYSALTNPSTRFVNNLVYVGVAAAGAWLAIGENFSVGALSCFLAYAMQYTKPFNEISGVITELQGAVASAARIFELCDAPAESDDSALPEMPKSRGNFDIKNVSFSYDKNRELIKNMNIKAASGKRVAIVGRTGCGKTTLINLLMRFYDVDGGEILLDGTDIRSVTRKSLRKNFGMVLQDTWIKSASVRDNIKLGCASASDDEVTAAAKAAHSHGFITRLSDGYDTIISNEGGMLSEGEKQLLSITRIMLTKPEILILDEATSSIDTRTEMKIQDAFAKLMEGHTCFIVAHRLSTIKNADIILVMDAGDIVESGTHDELLKKGGFYYRLYNSQFAKV